MSGEPLLSVCIPTYNRAGFLQSALFAAVTQAAAASGAVEIVVSDNCSSDHTEAVVRESMKYGPLRYYRNPHNVGAARNVVRLAQSLARGKYCWIVGDDDLLAVGAISRVIETLTANPDIDYLYVNSSHVSGTLRPSGLVMAEQYESCTDLMCDVLQDRKVDRWEHIHYFSKRAEMFTFIGNHILLTDRWRSETFNFSTDEGFPSLIATFPHSYVVARSMVGKRALYLGGAQIIVFNGQHEWRSFWPMIQIVRVMEFGALLREIGADIHMVNRYFDLQLRHSFDAFWYMVLDSQAPGRKYFSACKLLRLHWGRCSFWEMVIVYPANRLARRSLRPLKRTFEMLQRMANGACLT